MRKLVLSFVVMFSSVVAYSQVGIGTLTPDQNVQLEVKAEDKGILIPRVRLTSLTDRGPIRSASPMPNSLLVFNLTTNSEVKPGYYYWFTDRWQRVTTEQEVRDINTINQSLSFRDGANGEKVLVLKDSDDREVAVGMKEVIESLETLTALTYTDGVLVYTDEDKQATRINLKAGDIPFTAIDATPNADGTPGTNGVNATTIQQAITLLNQKITEIQGTKGNLTGDKIIEVANGEKSVLHDVALSIKPKSITADKIADGTITSDKIDSNAIKNLETLTVLSYNNSILSYKDEAGNVTNIPFDAGNITFVNPPAGGNNGGAGDNGTGGNNGGTGDNGAGGNNGGTGDNGTGGNNGGTGDNGAGGNNGGAGENNNPKTIRDVINTIQKEIKEIQGTKGMLTVADFMKITHGELKEETTSLADAVLKNLTISVKVASSENLGVVKQAKDKPTVQISEDGVLSVNTTNITDGLDGGGITTENVVINNPDGSTTTVKKLKIDAENGIHIDDKDNKLKLGGDLTKATEITTTDANTLAIKGLQDANKEQDLLVMQNTNGVLRKHNTSEVVKHHETKTSLNYDKAKGVLTYVGENQTYTANIDAGNIPFIDDTNNANNNGGTGTGNGTGNNGAGGTDGNDGGAGTGGANGNDGGSGNNGVAGGNGNNGADANAPKTIKDIIKEIRTEITEIQGTKGVLTVTGPIEMKNGANATEKVASLQDAVLKDVVLSVQTATADNLGVVKQAKDKPTVEIAADGTLSVNTTNITDGLDGGGLEIETGPDGKKKLKIKAKNGINVGDDDYLKLGGALTEAETKIEATADKTLAISGLQLAKNGETDVFVVQDATTSVLRKRTLDAANIPLAKPNNNNAGSGTGDAGTGGAGTGSGDSGANGGSGTGADGAAGNNGADANNGLTSTNVQDAINELNEKINEKIKDINDKVKEGSVTVNEPLTIKDVNAANGKSVKENVTLAPIEISVKTASKDNLGVVKQAEDKPTVEISADGVLSVNTTNITDGLNGGGLTIEEVTNNNGGNGPATTTKKLKVNAKNGINVGDDGFVKLGGALTEATTITTATDKTLAIKDLQKDNEQETTNVMVVQDPTTGVLKNRTLDATNLPFKAIADVPEVPATPGNGTDAGTPKVPAKPGIDAKNVQDAIAKLNEKLNDKIQEINDKADSGTLTVAGPLKITGETAGPDGKTSKEKVTLAPVEITVTATNGLTATTDGVKLGGTLSDEKTTINVDNKKLQFTNLPAVTAEHKKVLVLNADGDLSSKELSADNVAFNQENGAANPIGATNVKEAIEKLNEKIVTNTTNLTKGNLTSTDITITGDNNGDGTDALFKNITLGIASNAVTTEKINDAAVTENKIANNAVTENKIKDGAVTENKLGDNAVTTNKIKDGAITGDKIAEGTITAAKIGGKEAVTATGPIKVNNGAKVADAVLAAVAISVDTANGTNLGVVKEAETKPEIKVTNGILTIANGAITADKIAEGTITNDKITGKQSITPKTDSAIEIQGGADAVFVATQIGVRNANGNTSGVVKASGNADDPIQINDGLISLKDGAITADKIKDKGNITGSNGIIVTSANNGNGDGAALKNVTISIDPNTIAGNIANNSIDPAKISGKQDLKGEGAITIEGGKSAVLSATKVKVATASTTLGVVKQAAANPTVTIEQDGTLSVSTDNIKATLAGDLAGEGLIKNNDKLDVQAGNGIVVADDRVKADLGAGLTFDNGAEHSKKITLDIQPNSGLAIVGGTGNDANKLRVLEGDGVKFDNNGAISVLAENGLTATANGVKLGGTLADQTTTINVNNKTLQLTNLPNVTDEHKKVLVLNNAGDLSEKELNADNIPFTASQGDNSPLTSTNVKAAIEELKNRVQTNTGNITKANIEGLNGINVDGGENAVFRAVTLSLNANAIDDNSIDPAKIKNKAAMTGTAPVKINGKASETDVVLKAVTISVDNANGTTAGIVKEADQNAEIKVTNGVLSIANNAVTENKINNDAVTTSKIKNGAVTSDKIADNAVTAAKIGGKQSITATGPVKVNNAASVADAVLAAVTISVDNANGTNLGVVKQKAQNAKITINEQGELDIDTSNLTTDLPATNGGLTIDGGKLKVNARNGINVGTDGFVKLGGDLTEATTITTDATKTLTLAGLQQNNTATKVVVTDDTGKVAIKSLSDVGKIYAKGSGIAIGNEASPVISVDKGKGLDFNNNKLVAKGENGITIDDTKGIILGGNLTQATTITTSATNTLTLEGLQQGANNDNRILVTNAAGKVAYKNATDIGKIYVGKNGIVINNTDVSADIDTNKALEFTGSTEGSKKIGVKVNNAKGMDFDNDGKLISKNPWNKENSSEVAYLNAGNIYHNGNVGIGGYSSSTVDAKLHIKGGDRTQVRLENGSNKVDISQHDTGLTFKNPANTQNGNVGFFHITNGGDLKLGANLTGTAGEGADVALNTRITPQGATEQNGRKQDNSIFVKGTGVFQGMNQHPVENNMTKDVVVTDNQGTLYRSTLGNTLSLIKSGNNAVLEAKNPWNKRGTTTYATDNDANIYRTGRVAIGPDISNVASAHDQADGMLIVKAPDNNPVIRLEKAITGGYFTFMKNTESTWANAIEDGNYTFTDVTAGTSGNQIKRTFALLNTGEAVFGGAGAGNTNADRGLTKGNGENYKVKINGQVTPQNGSAVRHSIEAHGTAQLRGLTNLANGLTTAGIVVADNGNVLNKVSFDNQSLSLTNASLGVKLYHGLKKDNNGISIKPVLGTLNNQQNQNVSGLTINNDGVKVNLGDGLKLGNTNHIDVKAKANGAVSVNGDGVSVNVKNGLYIGGDNHIKLGGDLTEETTIDFKTFKLWFKTDDNDKQDMFGFEGPNNKKWIFGLNEGNLILFKRGDVGKRAMVINRTGTVFIGDGVGGANPGATHNEDVILNRALSVNAAASATAVSPVPNGIEAGSAKFRAMPQLEKSNTLVVADAAGVLGTVTRRKNQFYMPSVVLPTTPNAIGSGDTALAETNHNGGTYTVNLYNLYANQFGTAVKSNQNAALQTYGKTELDYFVTYYDATVFENVAISNAGVLTYRVKANARVTERTFMNIVFQEKW